MIKKGTKVKIISGKDKNKDGEIIEMDRQNNRAKVKGINMVKKYDHVVSSDLEYWLNYVEMNEDEFWKIADTFRSEKVWWIKNNEWHKNNIWGESSAYGEVRLSKDLQEKYK